MHTFANKKLLMLKPNDIISNRPVKNYDDYELQSLANSIAANGVCEPLSVRKFGNGKYLLISGERRLLAAKTAGLRRVPCLLHHTDDLTAAIYGITTNMHHVGFNCFEECDAINNLIKNFNLTQTEVAARLGMSNSAVSNKLKFLKLSNEIKSRIISANLDERYARVVLKIPPEQREDALNKIIAESLNVLQAEKLAEDLITPKKVEIRNEPAAEKPFRKSAIGDIKIFSNSLSKLISTIQNAGLRANTKRYENEKYIEFKVRIFKNQPEEQQYSQLKIC